MVRKAPRRLQRFAGFRVQGYTHIYIYRCMYQEWLIYRVLCASFIGFRVYGIPDAWLERTSRLLTK